MDHGRIPWPRPTELDVGQRNLYELITGGPRAAESAFALTDHEGRLEGPFNAMLLSPVIGTAVQAVGAAIRFGSRLTAREREIAILALASGRQSEFEWYAHERVGRRVGLTDDELSALANGVACSSLSEQERCVHVTAVALIRRADLDDAEYAAAAKLLGLPRLSEVITLVGYYDLLALSLRVWRTPLPADASQRWSSEQQLH